MNRIFELSLFLLDIVIKGVLLIAFFIGLLGAYDLAHKLIRDGSWEAGWHFSGLIFIAVICWYAAENKDKLKR